MSPETQRQIAATKAELEQVYDAMFNARNSRVTADLAFKAQRLHAELTQLQNGASALGVLSDDNRVNQ